MYKKSTKKQVNEGPTYDPVSERMVISALLRYGASLFYDVEAIVTEIDLYLPENKLLFSTIKNLILEDKIEKPDSISILAKIKTHDPDAIRNYDLTDYLTALGQESIPANNIGPFCKRIAKLSLIRNLRARLLIAADNLSGLGGKESPNEIVSIAEKPIIEFTNSLIHNDDTIKFADKIETFLKNKMEVKPGFTGIPSGFNLYDKAIGGGFRKPGVHVIGARAKVGKSFMGVVVADNVSKRDIPVLILDTELNEEAVMLRLAARVSKIPIDDVETGLKTLENSVELVKGMKEIQTRKVSYQNISGKTHESWISIMRRWIRKDVGYNPDGSIKDCLIILDYLKTMNTKDFGDLQEYQYLGQVITDLHNFCIQYNVPILSFVQLNREGISNDGQGVIAGSDRIVALCSSFTIMRIKEQQDFAQCPKNATGDRKLIVVAARFGPGLDETEYINLKTDLSKSQIEETVLNNDYKQNVIANRNLIQTNDNANDSATIDI